jgi:two-component system, cell cycle sensor histidine kinase and response regulator CckA
VQESGGVIRVESEPDVGTDFRIYLPVAIGPGDELTARPGEPVQCGTETLLVVEDDGKLRATVCRILASRGYRVLEAPDAAGALALAHAPGPVPHLVLTDVILPGPSGVDLARELVKRWRDVRVLFMSGYAGDHVSMGKAVRADACFLAKPFTPDVLLRAVREALTECPGPVEVNARPAE